MPMVRFPRSRAVFPISVCNSFWSYSVSEKLSIVENVLLRPIAEFSNTSRLRSTSRSTFISVAQK